MKQEEIEARVGQVVERWTLRRVIGRGGMASVYEGVDENGGRAAIKLLHDAYVGKGSVQRRFLREAFIMGTGKHPAAVKVYAQGLANGVPFFAMEYVDGESLQARWAKVAKMDPQEVVGYACSLLEILQAYHAEGVVHRDIKPANLMIAGGGLRLIDFGVARYRDMGTSVAEYTRDGATLGTPPFMAPEQALGKIDRIDHRSDLFAVGALMYALLSARFVHEGKNNDEMLIAAASKPAESLIVAGPKLPEALVRVVDKALSFYPNDRYQSADEMRTALSALQLGGGAPVKVPGAFQPSQSAQPAQKSGPLPAQFDAQHVKKAAAIAGVDDAVFESLHSNINEALQVMFRGLKRFFDAAQLYDIAHPEVQRRLDEAFALMTEILAVYPDDCGFSIRLGSFEVNDEPVWEPRAPFDQIPYRMFMNGMRHIRFRPDLGRDELRDFLHLVTMPLSELPGEDDLVTALWDLDLRHIDATMVSTFQVAEDVHAQSQFEVELRAIVEAEESFLEREAQEQIKLLELVSATGESGLAQAAMTSRDAVIEQRLQATTFASRFREQFVQALARDTWELRSAVVVSEALQDAWEDGDLERMRGSISAMLPRYLLQQRDADGFMLAERIAGGIANERVREQVLQWMFTKQTVGRLMLRLRYDDETWDDDTRRRASSLLADAPDDAITEVLPHFGAMSPKHRRVVMTYLMRQGTGRQFEYAKIAKAAPVAAALDMVRILERVKDDATPEALISLAGHDDERVREAVLKALSTEFPAAVEGILERMINDDSADLRVQALRLARSMQSNVVRDTLVKQVHSGKFHSLPFTERRLTMETIQALDSTLAESVCVEIARKKFNLTLDPAVATTRIMALGFLGEFGMSRDGWEALEEAAKRRPGNPENVREAAAAAIEKWRGRAQ